MCILTAIQDWLSYGQFFGNIPNRIFFGCALGIVICCKGTKYKDRRTVGIFVLNGLSDANFYKTYYDHLPLYVTWLLIPNLLAVQIFQEEISPGYEP
jgi:hypothetical protein